MLYGFRAVRLRQGEREVSRCTEERSRVLMNGEGLVYMLWKTCAFFEEKEKVMGFIVGVCWEAKHTRLLLYSKSQRRYRSTAINREW